MGPGFLFTMRLSRAVLMCALAVGAVGSALEISAQPASRAGEAAEGATPFATLAPAFPVRFPAETDSNSPVFWDFLDNGVRGLHIINSAGQPTISQAERIGRWRAPYPVAFTTRIDGGRWMEAVLQDDDGTLYGYYHNEPASVCRGVIKTAPRIGAARSRDRGLTWEDLGIIIEAPPRPVPCDTPNVFFYGGVGDFSVVLNPAKSDAYFFFSAYSGSPSQQGVAVARMLWQHRDEPRGKVAVWDGAIWQYPDDARATNHPIFPPPGPIFPAAVSWHDPSGAVDAFWGPSVHWNTYLDNYVMLLNRASNSGWGQEGIYIAFADDIADPKAWTPPAKLLSGGPWYPQVIGLTAGSGTDKQAGRVARLFVGGESTSFIRFHRSPNR
jgi:hypothetical protein